MDELRLKIIDLVNNSRLPIDAAFYVIKDVYRDISEMHDNALKELQEQANQEAEKIPEDLEEIVD